MRAALYVRVSTTKRSKKQGHESQHDEANSYDQNPEVQEQPLCQLAAQRGWEIVRVYADRASGAKEKRAALSELMADARRGRFKLVAVWRFDRFARSVRQLVIALEEFRALGIEFVSHQEALDTSTPMGKAMFTIIAAMAELERSVIRERVMAGLDHARSKGTRSGQPIGRPRVVFRRDQVAELRKNGLSWHQIARKLGVSAASVRRAQHHLENASGACQNPAVEMR